MKATMTKKQLTKVSDVFIITMVVAWIVTIITVTGASIYAMVMLSDTSVWSELCTLVTIPLTAGGVIWLFRQQPGQNDVEDEEDGEEYFEG